MLNFIKKLFTKTKDNDYENNTFEEDIKRINDYTRQYDPLNVDSIAVDDYLGLAASASTRAKIAIKEKNYELAWELYSEQSMHYFKHSEEQGQDPHALQGGVSHDKANVLRLEGNHTLALAHLIYAINTNPNVKYMMKKLPAYYNRSKITVSLDEVLHFIYKMGKTTDFRTIQNKIYAWDSIK